MRLLGLYSGLVRDAGQDMHQLRQFATGGFIDPMETSARTLVASDVNTVQEQLSDGILIYVINLKRRLSYVNPMHNAKLSLISIENPTRR